MSISTQFISFHPIDLASATISRADVAAKQDAVAYAADLADTVLDATDQREYKFTSDTTEVRQALAALIKDGKPQPSLDASQVIANRLLKTEKEAQKKVEHLGTVLQEGSLFQLVFKKGTAVNVLIAKVDLDTFLDQTDFKKHIGLPFERRILKTCVVSFKGDGSIKKVMVTATNNAEYWWKSFLELEEVITDEGNTKKAFHAIDMTLTVRLKQNHRTDYTYLRNNVIGYFRTQSRFSLNGFQKQVFGSYKPEDKNLDVERLKEEIGKLPEKKKFDTDFNVVDSVVKARFRRVIQLTEKIKLELAEDIPHLSNTIEAKQIDGRKGIFIKSDEGYETFHRTVT